MFGVSDVVALDIGSEKITVFCGNKSVNDTFNVKCSSSTQYHTSTYWDISRRRYSNDYWRDRELVQN